MRLKTRFIKAKMVSTTALIPTIELVNEQHFCGYPAIGIAFRWLRWYYKIKIGVIEKENWQWLDT